MKETIEVKKNMEIVMSNITQLQYNRFNEKKNLSDILAPTIYLLKNLYCIFFFCLINVQSKAFPCVIPVNRIGSHNPTTNNQKTSLQYFIAQPTCSTKFNLKQVFRRNKLILEHFSCFLLINSVNMTHYIKQIFYLLQHQSNFPDNLIIFSA